MRNLSLLLLSKLSFVIINWWRCYNIRINDFCIHICLQLFRRNIKIVIEPFMFMQFSRINLFPNSDICFVIFVVSFFGVVKTIGFTDYLSKTTSVTILRVSACSQLNIELCDHISLAILIVITWCQCTTSKHVILIKIKLHFQIII